MEILIIRIENENMNTAANSITIDSENPMSASAILKNINATNIGLRLLNFETNHPESGMPNSELIGSINKTLPSSASLRSKSDLMVGIRDAQVAKQNPESKKNMLKATRCFWFSFIYLILKAQISVLYSNCRNIFNLLI